MSDESKEKTALTLPAVAALVVTALVGGGGSGFVLNGSDTVQKDVAQLEHRIITDKCNAQEKRFNAALEAIKEDIEQIRRGQEIVLEKLEGR